MKNRIFTIACVFTAAALLAACTAVYKNSDACEQLMRSKLAETSSDTLKIGHTGAGIDGSRVVVEGSIEHVMTASEVAAAHAADGAAAGAVAGTTAGATAGATAGPTRAPTPRAGAADADAATAASGAAAPRAGANAASPLAASDAKALALNAAKPKKSVQAAAAECTFHGPTLSSFSWLAPAKLAQPSGPDSADAEE